MRYALVNCDIYTGDEVLYDKALIIENSEIKNITDLKSVPKELEFKDLKGKKVSPGFFDLQVNGGGGILLNDDPSPDSIKKIFNAHKKFGTTNMLITLISASFEKILLAIESTKSVVGDDDYGISGLHLEGPYINSDRAGVHDKSVVRSLTDHELEVILEEGKDVIKVITLAPEKNDPELIKKIKQSGIIVSVGHSNATYHETKNAFKNDISMVTHLFNAMSQFGSREPGIVGATLDTENIWAGIIADGYHVDFAAVRISQKIKKDRLFLVTDAMPPVGMGDNFSFKLGDLDVHTEKGKCLTTEGVLAGSGLDMASAIRNCVQHIGIPLNEALKMASTYPAQILGLDKKVGKIRPGYQANLAIMNSRTHVEAVVLNGKYEKI